MVFRLVPLRRNGSGLEQAAGAKTRSGEVLWTWVQMVPKKGGTYTCNHSMNIQYMQMLRKVG